MSTAQAVTGQRLVNAMGPLVDDESAIRQVLYCIELIKHQPTIPIITESELARNGMPLQSAMNRLRQRAYEFYQQKQA